MRYYLARVIHESFDQVDAAVRDALEAEGFGILTEIDVQAKFIEKLDEDIGRYVILGACAPPLARRAIAQEPQIGTLLPCNVVLRDTPDGVAVEAMDPGLMAEVTGNAALRDIATEVRQRLERALAALGSADVAG